MKSILSHILPLRLMLAALLMTVATAALAQAHFSWTIQPQGDDYLLLTIQGTLDEGWHVSSTNLTLEEKRGILAIGAMKESVNGQTVTYKQRYIIEKADYSMRGYLKYVLCSDDVCMAPQTVEFSRQGTATAAGAPASAAKDVAAAAPRDTARPAPAATVQRNTDAAFLESPSWQPVADKMKILDQSAADTQQQVRLNALGRLFTMFAFAFAGGLLAILTPCVWPMIPLTVSFFLRRGKKQGREGNDTRDALLYGACIVAIFLILGAVMTMVLGADAMNKLSTNAVFNLVCFAVLVAFGLSLLGVFQITLPSSWAEMLDRSSGSTTGIVSIFLMALTMVVVSFSCTAPVMGLILVEIASVATGTASLGSLLMPMVGMTGFALALALPFTLLALFPKLLKRFPRSGRWMHSVSVTLAFLELAFSLKFLSVADMAYGWHLLPRTLFIALWIILAFGCGVYHTVDWERRRVKPLRQQKMAIVCYAFVFYLLPGLHGAPCTMVSAFLPPSEDVDNRISWDYDEALNEARRQGKPVLIDFNGYGCVNCRKMEAAVLSDYRVREKMFRDFVVVQLYVDDRTPLPRHLHIGDKTLRTVGDKWAFLESYRFGSAAQPFYVIVNSDGEPLTCSYGYNESVEQFTEWMKSWKK